MKIVGTFGIGILDLSEDLVDALDSPQSIYSMWLGLAVVIGLTALLYIIFWVCLSKSLYVIASLQCSPDPTQNTASLLSDGEC